MINLKFIGKIFILFALSFTLCWADESSIQQNERLKKALISLSVDHFDANFN